LVQLVDHFGDLSINQKSSDLFTICIQLSSMVLPALLLELLDQLFLLVPSDRCRTMKPFCSILFLQKVGINTLGC
jgi:hypothetical protein